MSKKDKKQICRNFCANECINGNCPKALRESYEWYDDMGYDIIKKCSECYYNTNKCEDCIWENTEQCDKE